jgi:hypothetical protein
MHTVHSEAKMQQYKETSSITPETLLLDENTTIVVHSNKSLQDSRKTSFEFCVKQTADHSKQSLWTRPKQIFKITGKTNDFTITIERHTKETFCAHLRPDLDDVIQAYDLIRFVICNKGYPKPSQANVMIHISKDNEEEVFEFTKYPFFTKRDSFDVESFVIIPKNAKLFHDTEEASSRFHSKKFILCDENLVQNEYKMRIVISYD